ncbi:MAG TPA: flagellar biosynthesis protein FlhB [Clostridia bacterium]|nr:flagellar biosynthesis protein FlhB [Clostridia bacterium]
MNYPVKMNLQLFAGEKKHKATPKKRRDAREKGQVFKSADLSAAVVVVAGFLCIKVFGPWIIEKIKNFTSLYLDRGAKTITAASVHELGIEVIINLLTVTAPVLLTVLVAGLVIGYFQVGFLFTGKTLAFKLNRINPVEGFKRMFSLKGLVQLVKSTIKIAVISAVVYPEIKKCLDLMSGLMERDVASGATFIVQNVLTMAFKVCIALAVIGVVDYLYQWWEYEKDLRMTHQELLDEYKLTEGDPQIRGRIREKQRLLGMRRMMQDVPKADVVVVNPTHYAVALRYEEGKDNAPVVIAKGQGRVALKIREIAKLSRVEIVENPAVARTLYHTVNIGEEIPYDMYKAVAEILAYVYKVKKQGGNRS